MNIKGGFCYLQVTSNGPAMTWSMFSIGNIEIGNTVKASIQFLRQLNNAAKPFNVSIIISIPSLIAKIHVSQKGFHIN